MAYGPGGERENVIASPSGSVEPLSNSAPAAVALQPVPVDLVTFLQTATGGRLFFNENDAVSEPAVVEMTV
jgi:hypothetical protein